MSIFSKIMGAIFGGSASAAPGAAPGAAPASGGTAAAPKPMSAVDVAAVVDKAAAGKKEKLDWKHSIVDLMKALDLDSSLTNRKQLAHDLNYTGDTNDSASMNIWLHKQVMERLAKNAGKPTSDLMKK